MFRKEECARDMGQRSSYDAKRDVQTMFRKEECALSMGAKVK